MRLTVVAQSGKMRYAGWRALARSGQRLWLVATKRGKKRGFAAMSVSMENVHVFEGAEPEQALPLAYAPPAPENTLATSQDEKVESAAGEAVSVTCWPF